VRTALLVTVALTAYCVVMVLLWHLTLTLARRPRRGAHRYVPVGLPTTDQGSGGDRP
jgi:hypothetical protein